jgi:tape measure domain-containing protein
MADASVSIGFDATELASGVARARALMDGFSKDTVSTMQKAQSATLGRNFGQGIQDELRSLALFGNDTKVAFQEAAKAGKEAEQRAARIAELQGRLSNAQGATFNIGATVAQQLEVARQKLAQLESAIVGPARANSEEQEKQLKLAVEREGVLQNILRLEKQQASELKNQEQAARQAADAEGAKAARAQQAAQAQQEQAARERQAAEQRRAAVRLEASEANRLAAIRRASVSEDLAVLELRAAGQTREAAALERQVAVQRRATALARDLVISRQTALSVAERQIAAEERITAAQRARAPRAGGSAFSGLGSAAGGIAAGAGLYVGVAALGEFARQSVQVAAEVDSLRSGLASLGETGQGVERRIDALRKVTRDLKGLRFEDAVRGEINLRATGVSAQKAEEIIREFGNALLLVGRGEELGGVILALNQINGKGKVFAEEVNQIAERLPQIRSLMRDAFGTANTEEIQKMGLTFEQFVNRLLGQLAKLPRAMGSLKSDLTAVREETRQVQAEIGEMLAPGILGMVQFTRDTLKFAGALKEAAVNGEQLDRAIARAFGHAPSIKESFENARAFSDWMGAANAANAQYAEAIGKQLPGFNFEQMAKARIELEKISDALAETDEEKLARLQEKINAYKGALGGFNPEEVLLAPEAFTPEALKTAAELARLQRERAAIERSIADEVRRQNEDLEEQRKRNVELRDEKGQQVRRNAETRGLALGELQLLELQAAGETKKAEALDKQLRTQELMISYRDQLNLSEEDALKLAQRRVEAEEKIRKGDEEGGRRKIRGYSQEQESFKKSQEPYRQLEKLKRDQEGDFFERNQRTTGLDRLRDLQDRSRPAFGGAALRDQLNARNAQNPAAGRVREPVAPDRSGQGLEKLFSTAVEELRTLNKNLQAY